jgi:hypothetical protein
MLPAMKFFYYPILFCLLVVLCFIHILTAESVKLGALMSPSVTSDKPSKFLKLIKEGETKVRSIEQKITLEKQEIKSITNEQRDLLINFNRISEELLEKKQLDGKFLSKIKQKLLDSRGKA